MHGPNRTRKRCRDRTWSYRPCMHEQINTCTGYQLLEQLTYNIETLLIQPIISASTYYPQNYSQMIGKDLGVK